MSLLLFLDKGEEHQRVGAPLFFSTVGCWTCTQSVWSLPYHWKCLGSGMCECLVFLCFDFSPRKAKQGAARCVREGEKLREMPRNLERKTVSGGNAVCLKCGSLEVPAHFSDSLRMGWTGRAKEQGSSSVAVTAGSVLPPVTECCGGGTHTGPAKWWSSQLILRLESGEGPDRAVPHTEGSTLGDRWTFCFVHANIWRQEEIF